MPIDAPDLSRRRFLRVLGQSAALASLPDAVLAASDHEVTISILHTTDLHGHILPTSDYAGRSDLGGLARCATQIRRWQAENPHWALIDVGDVYQGTEVSLATQGSLMIRLLNALRYDAWVIGNHEFDWGIETLAGAVKLSTMPVLSGNSLLDPALARGGDFARLQPYFIKEVAGIRLAFIGLTTPGLAAWLPPENMRGFAVLDPLETLRRLLNEVAALRPDAIILAGHMGLTRRDDYANRIGALTEQFPQLTACLGAHTHQDHPGETINGVLYTQADHFGIHVGKVDLTFDRVTRRLLRRTATTVLMDRQIPFDPLVLSLAAPDLANADAALAQPMGELAEPFNIISAVGAPSDVERLIGSAMRAALRGQGIEVDLVAHGLFETDVPLAAGPKIVADAWTLLPYENQIVTIELTRDDLLALVRDIAASRGRCSVLGARLVLDGAPADARVIDLLSADGSPWPDKPSYRVALNSYDSQSGGQRLLEVGRLVRQPANRRVLHAIEIRRALIDYFVTQKRIDRKSLLV
jgi:2',3'-cyclic-nucleotide 2'-phosphodiesterase/3'-nucleotidase